MVDRMNEQGIQPPRLTAWETGDLIAFLFWLDYFDSPGDAEEGRNVFTGKSCVVCHQAGGVGGVGGPTLDFLSQYGTPIQVAAAMWNHGPIMAEAMERMGIARPTFTGSELTDLIAFLKAASPGIPEGPLYVLPGRADEGRNRFADKGCIQCHSAGGGPDRRAAPDLAARGRQWSLIEFAAAMWNKESAMTRAMVERGISVPQLRAGEMADVVAYLSSVQYFRQSGSSARGQRRIESKGCLDCHSLYGRGGSGPDLSRTEGLASPAAVIAAMWNHILVTESEPEGVTWPTLSPAEMADLAAFFQASGGNR
jgi:mono/diheme cytochrome c family protein